MVDPQGRFYKCQRPGITPDQLNQNCQEVPMCWPPLPISDLTSSLQGQGSLQPLFPPALVYPPHNRPSPPDCNATAHTFCGSHRPREESNLPTQPSCGLQRARVCMRPCREPPAGHSRPGVLFSGLSSGTSTFQLPHWTQSHPPTWAGRKVPWGGGP